MRGHGDVAAAEAHAEDVEPPAKRAKTASGLVVSVKLHGPKRPVEEKLPRRLSQPDASILALQVPLTVAQIDFRLVHQHIATWHAACVREKRLPAWLVDSLALVYPCDTKYLLDHVLAGFITYSVRYGGALLAELMDRITAGALPYSRKAAPFYAISSLLESPADSLPCGPDGVAALLGVLFHAVLAAVKSGGLDSHAKLSPASSNGHRRHRHDDAASASSRFNPMPTPPVVAFALDTLLGTAPSLLQAFFRLEFADGTQGRQRELVSVLTLLFEAERARLHSYRLLGAAIPPLLLGLSARRAWSSPLEQLVLLFFQHVGTSDTLPLLQQLFAASALLNQQHPALQLLQLLRHGLADVQADWFLRHWLPPLLLVLARGSDTHRRHAHATCSDRRAFAFAQFVFAQVFATPDLLHCLLLPNLGAFLRMLDDVVIAQARSAVFAVWRSVVQHDPSPPISWQLLQPLLNAGVGAPGRSADTAADEVSAPAALSSDLCAEISSLWSVMLPCVVHRRSVSLQWWNDFFLCPRVPMHIDAMLAAVTTAGSTSDAWRYAVDAVRTALVVAVSSSVGAVDVTTAHLPGLVVAAAATDAHGVFFLQALAHPSSISALATALGAADVATRAAAATLLSRVVAEHEDVAVPRLADHGKAIAAALLDPAPRMQQASRELHQRFGESEVLVRAVFPALWQRVASMRWASQHASLVHLLVTWCHNVPALLPHALQHARQDLFWRPACATVGIAALSSLDPRHHEAVAHAADSLPDSLQPGVVRFILAVAPAQRPTDLLDACLAAHPSAQTPAIHAMQLQLLVSHAVAGNTDLALQHLAMLIDGQHSASDTVRCLAHAGLALLGSQQQKQQQQQRRDIDRALANAQSVARALSASSASTR